MMGSDPTFIVFPCACGSLFSVFLFPLIRAVIPTLMSHCSTDVAIIRSFCRLVLLCCSQTVAIYFSSFVPGLVLVPPSFWSSLLVAIPSLLLLRLLVISSLLSLPCTNSVSVSLPPVCHHLFPSSLHPHLFFSPLLHFHLFLSPPSSLYNRLHFFIICSSSPCLRHLLFCTISSPPYFPHCFIIAIFSLQSYRRHFSVTAFPFAFSSSCFRCSRMVVTSSS